jgi:hypothetical protein
VSRSLISSPSAPNMDDREPLQLFSKQFRKRNSRNFACRGFSEVRQQSCDKWFLEALRGTLGDALCLSPCYRDRGAGIHCAKVIASQLRPAFSEGGDENAGELGGVPSGTLHLLVYVGTMEKSLAFSSTYGRGSWRTHDDGPWLLAKSDTSCAEGLFTQVPRETVWKFEWAFKLVACEPLN